MTIAPPKKSLAGVREKVTRSKSTSADSLDKLAKQRLQSDKLIEDLANTRSLRDLREDYAKKIFRYLVSYTVGAFALLFLHGFKVLGFELPTAVLGIVVGSTAVSAIGLVGIVARSLFRNQ